MKIVALVGPSGTGKSHRASMVAVEQGLDTILDDGLLIQSGRIVAGVSAKRESTRVAAVRRAILNDPLHAADIRRGLAELDPSAMLILGTSQNMVHRILQALGLPDDEVIWTRIEDFTTEDERALAQHTRQVEGKHVIPAPTMEVKKSFSGYLVSPLRYIFRGKGRQMEVEKSIVRPTYSNLGRFYIADTVITSLVMHVARQGGDSVYVNRVHVKSGSKGIKIQLDVELHHHHAIFDVLAHIQKEISRTVEYMTSLNVRSVRIDAQRLRQAPGGNNGTKSAGR